MNLKRLKLELFYIKKSFFEYKQGFKYLYYRFWLAKKILSSKKTFDRPINRDDFSIHLLTCHRDLVMTIWSLASFYENAQNIGQLYIHNDGSLTCKDKAVIKKFFPSAIVIEPFLIKDLAIKIVGESSIISNFRIMNDNLVLLKKLVDPKLVSEKKFKLVIDSDLIWYKTPKILNEFFSEHKSDSLMMANNTLCPVYFKEGKIDDNLSSFNSGVVLFEESKFSKNKLSEYFEKIDLDNKKNFHFIEQAAFAFCLEDLKKLPDEFYTIKNPVGTQTVLRHYTSPRRPLFYLEGVASLNTKIL